jgi:hypothetical protein
MNNNNILKLLTICFVFIISFSSAKLAMADIYDGLVAWYPFDGDAKDMSGNGNDGIVNGPIPTTDRYGNNGNAYSFDGDSDFIKIPSNSSINFGKNDFSISIWLKYGSQSSGTHTYSAIFIKSNNFDGPYEGFTMFVDYNDVGSVCFRLDATEQLFSKKTYLNDNTWRHFVCVRENNVIKIYINGYIDSYRDVSNIDISNLAPLILGVNNQYSWSQNYQGNMDDLLIYNRALSEIEVRELNQEQSYESVNLNNGLIAYYEFENNANDSSGNRNHGTENGGLRYSEGIIGNSAKFDGVDDSINIGQNNLLNRANTDFSISTWIKIEKYPQSYVGVIVSNRPNSGWKGSLFFIRGEADSINKRTIAFDTNQNDSSRMAFGKTQLQLNNWYHSIIVFQYKGSNNNLVEIYLNGELETLTRNITDIIDDNDIHYIGFEYSEADDSYHFKGNIDDLRIYNRPLSPSEINALYLMGANAITTEIQDKNTQPAENISLKDIGELDNQYYAISNKSLYVSIDAEKFIHLHKAGSPLNAIASAWYYVLAVGDNNTIVMYNATTEEVETIIDKPNITENFIDVAVADDQYIRSIIVGTNGTIIKGIGSHFTKIDSPTTADITSVSYDQASETFYATTSNGELLTSTTQDMDNWTIQKTIPNTKLTSFEKHNNIIVLTAEDGKIYYTTDNTDFTSATVNTSDHFVDVWFVKDKFVAATQNQLFISKDAQEWNKDTTDFSSSPIQNLFLNKQDKALFVLTEKGIRKLYQFNQIESGTIKEATLGGVNVRFENSSVTYENSQIKSLDIQPDDTMYILNKKGKTIAKIEFSNASIQDASQNGIPFSRANIYGNNLLSYWVAENQFSDVSQGEFILQNKKVMEMPLLNPGTTLKEKIRLYITDFYQSLFSAAAPATQQTMLDDILLETILNKAMTLAKIKNYKLPITANYLLLGSPENAFSPLVLSSPFFRKLWLDTTTGKIKQTDTFFFGPKFIAQELLSLFDLKKSVKVPKLTYEVSGHKLTGTVSKFQMTFGPFKAISNKAQVVSDLSDDQADDYILLDKASFQLKTKNKGTQKNQGSGSIGLNACKIKLAHNKKDGFRLKSGEVGGELKLSNIQLTKQWTLKKLHTTLKMLARKKDPSDTSRYLDKYPDELNDLIVTIGGEGKLVKKSLLKKNTLSISAAVEVALDEDSLDFYGNDRQNLIKASMGVKSKLNYPPKGPFTLEGAGIEYVYKKGDIPQSFWKFKAYFNIYRLAPSVQLFKGQASVMSDTDFESIALEISSLRTYFPLTDYNLNWMGHKSTGSCAFYGKIYPNHPLKCPGIRDCNNHPFYLKPLKGYFEGIGLGIAASVNMMHKNKILSIGSTSTAKISFEEIIKAGIGAKILGVGSNDSYEYDVQVGLVGNILFQLPKVKSKYIPSNWIDKESFYACVSLTHIKITEKLDHWIAEDENIYLGKVFGLMVSFNKNKLFIPFSRLVDNDGEQIYFIAPMFHKQFTLSSRKRASIRQGDVLTDQFAINQSSQVIIDLASDNNDLSVIMPDNRVITQESENSDTIEVYVKNDEYTVLYIHNPPPGAYTVTYRHTGNERLTIYGANDPPTGTISLNNNSVSFEITDTENDPIDYRLAIIDENSQPIHYLLQNQGTDVVMHNYEITGIHHLETGSYKLALIFKDELNTTQQIITENTIVCEKSIPKPENLDALVTTDYVDLSWDTAKGVEGYTISIWNNDELIYQFDIASGNLTIQDLMEGSYTAVVKGYDQNGLTGDESQIDFSVTKAVSAIIPEPVSNIRVDFGNPIKISWDSSANADFYLVNLKKGNVDIISDEQTTQTEIEPGQDEIGAVLTISITAKNKTNNSSEPVIKSLNMFDSTDLDNDTLPDMWETRYFQSINLYSGNDDADLDGLSNAIEYSISTDPIIADTDKDKISDKDDPNPLLADDFNANIIPDDWEEFYGITDILADSDKDGYTNYIEFLADLDPLTEDEPGIDISGFRNMAFSPVLISNRDHLSMIRKFAPFVIDLSQSFDINGDDLSFEWMINGDKIESNSSCLTLNTSRTGMYRVEVNVRDSEGVAYQKYSIFVNDGQYYRIEGGKTQAIQLSKYTFNFPAASTKSNSYLLAGEISKRNMPVRIMGREFVTDGAAFFYSDNYLLDSPVTVVPYLKADNEIEPYIFNYSTSVWTNLETGETFTPINTKRFTDNSDQTYAITTRETGLLVFARKPQQIDLKPVTSIDTYFFSYYVDLDTFKDEHQLSDIDEIILSDSQIIEYQRGMVSGSDQLMVNILKPGTTEVSIVGSQVDGSIVRYSYILEVVRAKLNDDLFNAMTVLKICSGIDPFIDTTDLDFNQNQQIDLADAIYLLQRLAEIKSEKN